MQSKRKVLSVDLNNDIDSVFTEIYQVHHWSKETTESRSGAGSTLRYTQPLRKKLPGLIKKLNIDGILDIPCSDFNWMAHVSLPNE